MNDQERSELVTYRLKRANDTLAEIDILVANGLFATAINRMYYACYYAAVALLLHNEIQANTHAGVRQMLGLHFIKTELLPIELGKFYSNIFDKRQSSDYDDFISFTKEEIEFLKPKAEALIYSIEQLINRQ